MCYTGVFAEITFLCVIIPIDCFINVYPLIPRIFDQILSWKINSGFSTRAKSLLGVGVYNLSFEFGAVQKWPFFTMLLLYQPNMLEWMIFLFFYLSIIYHYFNTNRWNVLILVLGRSKTHDTKKHILFLKAYIIFRSIFLSFQFYSTK